SSSATTTEPDRTARVVKAGLKQPAGCFLTVFLAVEATRPQTSHVQAIMVKSGRVSTIAFVSKALAVKRFAERNPVMAGRMHKNPFPDSFEIVPLTKLDVYPIITTFAAGVPGVVNVRASEPCGRA